MGKINIIMPKMGESVAEATIIKWVKEVGDNIEIDETIVEIATDKVDSEIPSIAKGVLVKKLYQENDIVKVGEIIAIIEDETISSSTEENTITIASEKIEIEQNINLKQNNKDIHSHNNEKEHVTFVKNQAETEGEKFWRESQEHQTPIKHHTPNSNITEHINTNLFFSPLVKSIAKKENISTSELEQIKGTGKNSRITKKDILNYINQKSTTTITPNIELEQIAPKQAQSIPINKQSNETEIIEMDRMRKLIAKHMIESKATSAHVTSFVEADVSKVVEWRDRIKNKFLKREGQKITYTPIIFESIIKAILDFPLINISVEGDNIVKHKNINLGMATALPSGNLIVPVIKKAQEKNILGLTKAVNDLANRARENQLEPDEVSGGTFTVTNVGSFGSIMGTPIINQPQVAILALGKIQKKPTVIETDFGDTIGIRSKMFLSLSYDHRVVDGALGGQFLQRIAYHLESFDTAKEI